MKKNMQKKVLLLLVAMAFFVTTIGAASAATNDTTLTLQANDNDINLGETVDLTARLRYENSNGNYQNLGPGAQVTFLLDGVVLGTNTTNNQGYAYYHYIPTTPGEKVFTATYAGNANPQRHPSTSSAVHVIVRAYNPNSGVTPQANDDAVTNAVEDTPFAAGVAGNDALGSGTNTWAVTTAALHGTVVMNPLDGTYTYTPASNYFGTDTFTYNLTATNREWSWVTWSFQNVVRTDSALVTITIANVNDAPVAVDNTVSTPEDTASGYDVLSDDSDVDGDTLTIISVTQPTNGQAVNHGTYVEYIPNSNYNGPDQFTYTISDGNGGTATATVFMTVTPVNDAPVAVDDTANTNEDNAVTINVLANDSDVEGDAFSITGVTQSAHGSVVINGDGTVTYTPNSNWNGVDTFTYTITDVNGGSNTATVTVTVGSVPDADLVLTKTVNNAAPVVKDTVIFTLIVNNNGPDTAVGVTVYDKLPAGLSYVSSVANFGTYDPNTGLWTIDSLPNGASAVLTITSVVEQSGQIINQANVTALTWDPNLEGNAASAAINAQEAPDEPEVSAKTVAMQKTGAPIFGLLLAFFMLVAGLVIPKRK